MKPISPLWIILLIIVLLVLVLAIMAIRLFTSVERYAQYWARQSTDSGANNSIVYVALGDSAAQGIGASSPENGYVGLIAKRLSDQKSRPVHTINLSKSGAKVADVTKNQIPLLTQLKPGIITLDIGGNDIKSFDAVTFESQAEELFSMLPANTLVADIPFFGGRSRFLDPKSDEKVLQANSILRKIAGKYNITIVPIYKETKRQNQYPWSYSIDYFHPNNSGYRSWFSTFWKEIEKLKY